MKLQLKFFGIAKEIIKSDSLSIDMAQENVSVNELMEKLKQDYPQFAELQALLVAVNSEYADMHVLLNENDEIAIIPPVSGG
jgi:molybdopterin converting factor subunit 1